MKHTPGPWRLEKYEDRNDEYYEIWPDNGKTRTRIARVGEFLNYSEREQVKANARLIAVAPELLNEHKDWSKILGHIIVKALQKDYEYLDTMAKLLPIEYRDGEPYIKSEAIFKAGGTD